MKKFGNLLWGLFFIAIGVIVGLNTLGIAKINIFFNGWWTLFIIVPCLIGFIKDNEKTGSLIGLLIGIVLLLSCQNILDFDLVWKLLIPVILVIIGLSIIFKDSFHTKINNKIDELNKKSKDNSEICATFSTQDVDYEDEEFNGAELNAVFGGVKIDLRRAIINKDVIINSSAIFGGITILVPKDVNIKTKSTPIFGGISNDTRGNKHDNKYTIYINSISVFGGVDIK